MLIEINKLMAKHILAYDTDCGSCHIHKFVEINKPRSKKPRFNCKYNKKFRKLLSELVEDK